MILAVGMAEPIWSEEDIATLKAAIMKLAAGERVEAVSYSGPPARQVTYSSAQLPELEALLARVEKKVNEAPTYRRVAFDKGFRRGC